MIGFLIAILSGALMSVQGVFNTDVYKRQPMRKRLEGRRENTTHLLRRGKNSFW